MRPAFYVTGLSAAANDRVTNITLTDSAGVQSDEVSIRLDDRDYALALPPHGQVIQVQLGYAETGLVNMGTFEVDDVSGKSAQARTVLIKAKAQAHVNSDVKAPKTQPWDEKTLGEIVGAIAMRNGYIPEVDPSLAGIWYDHLDQSHESDTHFLTRIAQKHDAYSKFQDGKLLFKPRQITNGLVTVVEGNMVQQSAGGARTVATEVSWTLSRRSDYQSVRASWKDRDKGEHRYEVVGSGEPQFDMKHVYENKGLAREAAHSKLKELLRGTGTVDSVSFPGDPYVRAEMTLVLQGMRPEICGVDWVVVEARHVMDGSSGYKTTAKLERELKS